SQNNIDPPSLINDSTVNKELIKREQNSFLLGWNWGSPGEKLDDALYINAYHDMPDHPNNDKVDSIRSIEQFLWGQHILGNRFKNAIINSMSVYFEPTIYIDTVNRFQA